MSEHSFDMRAEVLKVDETLGLVFGYGIICTKQGEPYYDRQGDHVTEKAMLEAAADFMEHSQVSGDMHAKADGRVVFMFPLTSEVAKAFDLQSDRTGLLVAVRPSPGVLEKFRSGEYTGFSIGGERVEETVVEQ